MLQTEPGSAGTPPRDPDDVIHDWFLTILKDNRQKDVADALGVTNSKVWKLKKGHQRLSAAELLTLHEALNVRLPKVTGTTHIEPTGKPKAIDNFVEVSADDHSRLFKLAYDQVNQKELAKPEDQRLDKFEKLERVFHLLTLIEQTPDAMELDHHHE